MHALGLAIYNLANTFGSPLREWNTMLQTELRDKVDAFNNYTKGMIVLVANKPEVQSEYVQLIERGYKILRDKLDLKRLDDSLINQMIERGSKISQGQLDLKR
jgi:hypothetical protein